MWKKMKKQIIYLKSLPVVLFLGILLIAPDFSHAQTNIEKRFRYHDNKLGIAYKQIDLTFRLTNAMAKKILSEKEYERIVLEPVKEATNEK